MIFFFEEKVHFIAELYTFDLYICKMFWKNTVTSYKTN